MEPGQILAGAKWNYRLMPPLKDGVHESTVFKAEMLPKDGRLTPAKWALIKMAPPSNKSVGKSLRREYNAYRRPCIASNPCFRSMLDIIGDFEDLEEDTGNSPLCLVLEWTDCTLAQVPSERHLQSPVLINAIIESALSSCDTLSRENLISKPDNILLSDVDTDHPVVKIGDLGLVYPDGYGYPVQPYAMRAPEVYQGLGCINSSQVWALAATILCWIKPGIFGTAGNRVPMYRESWSIANLKWLFAPWAGPPSSNYVCKAEFEHATSLIKEEREPEILKVLSLEDEMQSTGMPSALKSLLRSLLVIDPSQRPSAADVLQSAEYLALKRKALEMVIVSM